MTRAFTEPLVRGPLPVQGTYDSFATLERLTRSVARHGMRCLEIGSWLGYSATRIGGICREHSGALTCVDTWQGSESTSALAALARENDIYQLFLENIERAGLTPTVRAMRIDSAHAADALRGEEFDLVFIDGDHVYEAVRADIERFAPLVKAGGILCGHDCLGPLADFDPDWIRANLHLNHVVHPRDSDVGVHPGVVLAVHETFPGAFIENEVWWVHRQAGNESARLSADRTPHAR